jgi:predicted branched-subunit amino acid permease
MSTFSATAATGVEPAERPTLAAARRGGLAVLPMLAAYIPFALVVGSVATEHGGPFAAWAGGWLIFGGSAQLATVRTFDAGTVAAILTGLLVNARLLVYSASLGRQWAEQPRWFRFAAAGLIIDPTWAVGERHAAQCDDLREQRGYFLGAALTLGTGWTTAIAVGALIGARLDSIDLSIVIPLCLLGLIGAGLRARGARSVIVVSAAVALLTASWPSGTGLLMAVAAGCVTGMVNERRSRK